MNIAVYSGSFNPLHIGHLAIMKYLIGEGGFDCVYLVVSPKNPLKDINAASGMDRYRAAEAAVNRHFSRTDDIPYGCNERAEHIPMLLRSEPLQPSDATDAKVKVDDIELTMPEPHYTIRTLDALKEREPGNSFTLVMGADNLADIRRWREYSRILKEYGAAVYPRKGFDLDQVKSDLLAEDPAYRITLLNAEMVDISSTIIRNAITEGQDMSGWLM